MNYESRPWVPTHILTSYGHDVPVMLDDYGSGYGIGYQRCEWEECISAYFELKDGKWFFLGMPFPGSSRKAPSEETRTVFGEEVS